MSDALAARLWSVEDLCTHLGCARATFYARREEMDRHGFPAPVPGTNRWQPLAVIAWEFERSTGRRMDGIALLEAAGLSADPSRILAARAAQLMR